MLKDPEVDIILNLTPPLVHAEITKQAILSKKHVYSEKPLTTSLVGAVELQHLADKYGVRLGCAPDVFLGEVLQLCKRLVDEGEIGEIFGFSANMMKRGIETWHPNPQIFYQAGGGPLLDMGPYYLSALVFLLGKVEMVYGVDKTPFSELTIQRTGEKITVEVPTFITSIIKFKCGVIGNLNMSFDVHCTNAPHIELYGTRSAFISRQFQYREGSFCNADGPECGKGKNNLERHARVFG